MIKPYTDQFTIAQLEYDFSYDGLSLNDIDELSQHLAPFGRKSDSLWQKCNGIEFLNQRIDIVSDAIRKAASD